MTIFKLFEKIRRYTKQTSASLTDAELLLIVNPLKDEMSEQIATRDIKGNYFIIPSLDDLTADRREYAWPDDVLDHIYSVEFAFNQNTPIEYTLALPDDFRRFSVGRTEENINSRYSNAFPRYEVQRRAIYLLSGKIDSTTLGGSTVSDGIRIRYRAYPADFTGGTDDTLDLSLDPTTTTFGFPKPFHELLARRSSIEWKGDHPGAVPLSPIESKYDVDLEKALAAVENNDFSGEVIGQIPYQTGQEL